MTQQTDWKTAYVVSGQYEEDLKKATENGWISASFRDEELEEKEANN